MPTNVVLFRDPAQVRHVTSTELKELFEFGFDYPGTWLFLAQGHAFADNAQLRLRLELGDGSDDIRMDFGASPGENVGRPFSLRFGVSVSPVTDPLIMNRVRFGASVSDEERVAGVGEITIDALAVDSVSSVILGAE